MYRNPAGRFDESESPIAQACQGVRRIALPVKDDNATFFGDGGCTPIIPRPAGYAVVFKARAPGARPVGECAMFMNIRRKKCLLIPILLPNSVLIASKIIQ